MSSSEERSLQEFCSQYNVDETACKSYVEHLEFLDAKAKKRVRERNALPSNISWQKGKRCGSVTNNQLKMYLKQHGLEIRESKADLTILNEFSATHVEMQPEMFWKMKNLITCVKTTQLQNQSQVIPMERTHTLKSHLKYFLCLMKTCNT